MKKLVFKIGIFITLLILLSGCFNSNKNYVIIIGNDKISVDEFNFYLYNVQTRFEFIGEEDIWETSFEDKTAEEAAKEVTLNSICDVKISSKQAKGMNISLTKEEKTNAIIEAKNILDNSEALALYNIKLTESQLTKIIEETLLRNKVYDKITDNFELNENDFREYLKEYLKENPVTDEQSIQQSYIDLRKKQIGEQEYKKWSEKIKIEINTEIWDKIKIIVIKH